MSFHTAVSPYGVEMRRKETTMILRKIIPARYIGDGTALQPRSKPYLDADGKRLKSLQLQTGDTIMMDEAEVIGQTYLFDSAGKQDPLYLGAGHKILPEHKDLTREEIAKIYEFHIGREDFEPLNKPEEESSTTIVVVENNQDGSVEQPVQENEKEVNE